MDPINTPAAPSNPVAPRSAGFSLRQLWQAPLFFLGVVVLITVCLTRGMVQHDPVRELHRDLTEARRLLRHRGGDVQEALRHARRAVDNLMYDPNRGAEAFFLLGSAHIRVADADAESDGAEHWREARECLQEAARRGLAGDDGGRLQYRLAKVGFHLHDDPKSIIALLEANKDQADDRAEAYTLLTQAYLRLNPPDLKAALKANRGLREVPQIGEDVLGPAKLTGAQLLLRLHQQEEARKTLEKINDQAPPSVLAEAHRLLARLYQDERKWPEAAELWKAVLAEKRVPPAEQGLVLYNLGDCYRQLDQWPKAAEAWTACLRQSHGEEAQAAALALAELRLREPTPSPNGGEGEGGAVEMLAEGVSKVRKADDWKNSLVELPRVRDLFEKAVETYRQANRFDLAVQAAELYERVALAPKAQLKRADLSGEWARSAREQARSAQTAAARKKGEANACQLFRQAADAHNEAAKLLSDKADKDEHLWLSAVCSFDGQDFARAADKLGKILQVHLENIERQSEGWYLLGESYRNLKNKDAAREAYKNCVANGVRFTCRARYQLALFDIEAGQIDSAILSLEQNLKLDHRDPDPDAQEKSRFALCSLLYQGGSKVPQNYHKVIQHLEGNLDRCALSPEAVRARYQLADSYRKRVDQGMFHYASEKMSPEVLKHHLEENRRWTSRAAEEFAKLEELIADAELASLLTVKQRVETPFIVAECWFHLGEYEKALKKLDELAKKWGNTPEGLFALGWTIRCFGAVGDYDRLQQRAKQINDMMATTAGLTNADKQQLRDWLALVSKTPPQKN